VEPQASLADEALCRLLPNAAAWEELFRRYRPVLLAWFLGKGCSSPDAEDLVQSVMMRVLRTPDAGRPYNPELGPFRNFLFVVARNALLDHIRRQRPGVSLESMDPGEADAHLASDEMEVFFQREEKEVELRLLAEALKQLDLRERQLFDWHYVEGRSTRDIAEHLECSPSKAWLMVRAVLDKLRRHIQHTPPTNG
jgi:RNA polymerase sigma factor (sigma-70 family)